MRACLVSIPSGRVIFPCGHLDRADEYALRGQICFKNELLLMLKVAGFKHIAASGDYADEEATAEHEDVVFMAIKGESSVSGPA
jgi:hypothetical protein